MSATRLTCQRELFDLPSDVHYLNCAYMGPLPRPVQEAGFAGIRRKAVPTTIAPADFFTETDRARALFAELIQAPDPARVAIIPAASYGIAIAARNTLISGGQNIVVSAEQFPSNVYAWRELAVTRTAELRAIGPTDSAQRGESWNAALLDAIDESTAVVALPHVHWTDGTRFDLEAIGARCREHGAALVVDGTQSVGALPFDVQRIKPDALICAAYKWLLGPYSIGAAWFGSRFDAGEPLEENWISRRGSEDFRGLVQYQDQYQPGAARFDVGERSNFALMPMFVRALELILEWQPQRIQDYCATLCGDTIAAAASLGFRVEAAQWRGAHLFGLRAPAGLDMSLVQAELQKRNVFASLRGSALRVAPNVYNTPADVDALIGALRAALNAGGISATRP